MPIMFGFARQRRKMLEVELERFIQEMPTLGMLRMWVVGDLTMGTVSPASDLDLVVVQQTDEPWRRRADFWQSHLRPRVGVTFHVFTPDELEELAAVDPILRSAQGSGELVYG